MAKIYFDNFVLREQRVVLKQENPTKYTPPLKNINKLTLVKHLHISVFNQITSYMFASITTQFKI